MPTLDIYLRQLDGSHRRIRSSPDSTFRHSALTRHDYWFTNSQSVIRVGTPVSVDSWEEVERYDGKPDLDYRRSLVIVDEGSPHAISYGDAPPMGWLATEYVPEVQRITDSVIASQTASDEDKLKAVKAKLNAEANSVIRKDHGAQRKTMRHIRMERAKSRAGKADLQPPLLKLGFLVIVACVVLVVIIFGAIVGTAFLESRQDSLPPSIPQPSPAASLLLLPFLGAIAPAIGRRFGAAAVGESKDKVERELLFLFTETYVYQLMVPVTMLDEHLDYRARSRPTAIFSRLVGAGVLAVLLSLLLYGVVLAVFGTSALIGGTVLALVFGLPAGAGIGALVGPHTPWSPRPFWIAERRRVASRDAVLAWLLDKHTTSVAPDSIEIVSRVYGDNLDEFDIRTPKGLKDASEGREAFFLFSAGMNNWQKVQLGGVIILLISVIFLMFLMATVVTEG